MRRAALVGEAHAQGRSTQGATTVITGCPGSGKSAFLGHFARTFATLGVSNNVLIPVQCNHQDLTRAQQQGAPGAARGARFGEDGEDARDASGTRARPRAKARARQHAQAARAEDQGRQAERHRRVPGRRRDPERHRGQRARSAAPAHARVLTARAADLRGARRLRRTAAKRMPDLAALRKRAHDDGRAPRERCERGRRDAVREVQT